MSEDKNKRPLWKFPWAYQEGFVVALGLLSIGLLLEASSSQSHNLNLTWPLNLVFGTGFTAFLISIYLLFRKNPIIKWLAGVPASISSISLIGFIVIFLGFFPQAPEQTPTIITTLGFNHVTTSWPFLFSVVYFMITLGFAGLKRIIPFKKNSWGYLLNHLGLWITLLSASLGSADLQRLTMDLHEGKMEWRAKDEHGHIIEMPLAIQLNDFKIDEYRPKAAIVSNTEGRLLPIGKPKMLLIENDSIEGRIMDWNVKILSYVSQGKRIDGRYEKVNEVGAGPAAKVEAVNRKTKEKITGWISCGSFMMQPESIKLNDAVSLVMTAPEPKKFSSDVKILTQSGKEAEAVIEVNKPFRIDGWSLYQLSYDARYGKWSPTSVIEIVRDPWLPAVYVGVFMMIFGAVYIIWAGKNKNINSKQ
ncbi:MAG: cytochrome c biogenesis protein ResB [Cytophagales bacterium]|nr:cytochrome c biogenesis protein ResB [Cytophagales bacterium]